MSRLSDRLRWGLAGAAALALGALVVVALAVRPGDDSVASATGADPAMLAVRLVDGRVEVVGRVRDDASAAALTAAVTDALGGDVSATGLEVDAEAPTDDALVPHSALAALASLQAGTLVRAGHLVLVNGVVGTIAARRTVEQTIRDAFGAGFEVGVELAVGAATEPSLLVRSEGELVDVHGVMANAMDRDAVLEAAEETFGAGTVVTALAVGRALERPPWVDGLPDAIRAMEVFRPGWTLEVAPGLDTVLVGGTATDRATYADAIARISGATGLTVRAWVPVGATS